MKQTRKETVYVGGMLITAFTFILSVISGVVWSVIRDSSIWFSTGFIFTCVTLITVYIGVGTVTYTVSIIDEKNSETNTTCYP